MKQNWKSWNKHQKDIEKEWERRTLMLGSEAIFHNFWHFFTTKNHAYPTDFVHFLNVSVLFTANFVHTLHTSVNVKTSASYKLHRGLHPLFPHEPVNQTICSQHHPLDFQEMFCKRWVNMLLKVSLKYYPFLMPKYPFMCVRERACV